MRIRGAVLVVSAVVAVLGPASAYAQEAAENARAGLTVSPPLAQLSAEPGTKLTQTFRVYNEGTSAERVTADLLNWAPGEDGASVIFPDEPTEFAMAEWMSVKPQTARVPAGESVDFTLTVNVPRNAGPGGRYGAVNFRPVRPPVPGAVQVEQVVSALVLLEVSGNIVQGASLTDFGARTRAVAGSPSDAEPVTVLDTAAFDFLARVRNTGNVHLRPTHIVEVSNVFGTPVETVDNTGGEGTQGLVLPSSERAYRVPMQGELWPGFYRARVTTTYADGQPPLTATTSFWYIPMWFRLGAPLVLVALIALIVYRRSRRSESAPATESPVPQPSAAGATAMGLVPHHRDETVADTYRPQHAAPSGTVLPGDSSVPGPRPPDVSEHGDPIGPVAPPEAETER